MKIGLYFGTFNPIHAGHLIIANHMAENSDLDQVWLVVTPHNPFKKKTLCSTTTIDCKWRTCYRGFSKIETLRYWVQIITTQLHGKYLGSPRREIPKSWIFVDHGKRQLNILIQMEKFWSYFAKSFDLCLSTDRSQRSNWRNNFIRIRKFRFKNHPKVHLIDAPIVEISSTFIRKSIKEGKIFSLYYRLKFGNILIIIIFTRSNHSNTIFSSASISWKALVRLSFLADNKKLLYLAFACCPKLFSISYLE